MLYAVPTGDQVTRFWFEVTRALAEPIEFGVYRALKGEHLIEKPGTEARIRAKTAWNADSLRGDFADLLILDEWQLMDEEAWEVVGAPMLIDNNGDAVFIYTPPSIRSKSVSKARDPRHAAKMFAMAEAEMKLAVQESRTSRWLALHFSSRQNPHISEEGLQEITKDMTRLAYKQEILAEDVKEVPGAMWNFEMLEDLRVRKEQVPPLERISTGVDPSGSQITEAGIVSAGRGAAPIGWSHPKFTPATNDALAKLKHYYIIRDSSLLAPSPKTWASTAVRDYKELKGDGIAGERNYGGDMVESTVRAVEGGDSVAYHDVSATRGKVVRAQPVAALYERGMVHHVDNYGPLEDEMCSYIEGDKSPNRMDALVWSMWDIMQGQDVLGFLEYLKTGAAEIQMKQEDSASRSKVHSASTLIKPTIADEAPKCPKCEDPSLQDIPGGQKRCMACGHQFWIKKPELSQPQSRSEFLK